MIWYQDEKLTIRNMDETDAQVFTDEETAQGWHADISKYLMRLKDQADGKCVSLTALFEEHQAGYVNVYRTIHAGPFKGTGWPVIVDFGVLEKYRRRGIGGKLMDTAEQIAGQQSDTVCIGVGLHNGYGSAQRMYVKRGYVPDGSGVWYRGKPCTPYDTVYTNDDDMVLYLSKKLSGASFLPDQSQARTDADGCLRAIPADAEDVARMACELWPEHTADEMTAEYQSILTGKETAVFLYRKQGQPAGFAQCQLRHDYVEGTETSPVGYLEGIYVRKADRLGGMARVLLTACEDWARGMGCKEFASDCELANTASQRFHLAAGFEEANRLVAYIKKL